MQYDIIVAPSTMRLKELVGAAVSLGWEPMGGPFQNKDAEEWCQAVIKRPDAKPGDLQLREKKR